MALSFAYLLNKLNEAGPPPPAPPVGAKSNNSPIAGPPTNPIGPDPLSGGLGGGGPPMNPGGGLDSLGGGPSGATPSTTGKPKIIKITTVWDALENSLDNKVKNPKTKEHNPNKKKEDSKPKSIYT